MHQEMKEKIIQSVQVTFLKELATLLNQQTGLVCLPVNLFIYKPDPQEYHTVNDFPLFLLLILIFFKFFLLLLFFAMHNFSGAKIQ